MDYSIYFTISLTLFRIDLFGATHGWGGGGLGGGAKGPSPLSKICHTYPTIMKLGTLISCLRKIKKICKKYRYRLNFDALFVILLTFLSLEKIFTILMI